MGIRLSIGHEEGSSFHSMTQLRLPRVLKLWEDSRIVQCVPGGHTQAAHVGMPSSDLKTYLPAAFNCPPAFFPQVFMFR